MNILQFLWMNVDSVIVVLVFIGIVLMLIKRGETQILHTIVFNLVTQAEKQFGNGTGMLKFSAVVDWLYQRFPVILRLLFTKKDLEKLIEDTLAEAKKSWAVNPNLEGYIKQVVRRNNGLYGL